MAKTKSIAKLVDDCAAAMQLYVRVKAADEYGIVECVTCGTRRHYKDRMQGGHFIGRKWLATKLLEENIHTQCAGCNGPLRGSPVAYTLYMIDMYGRDFVEELQRKKHEPTKYYKNEIIELTKEIKEKTKQLQKEKGI